MSLLHSKAALSLMTLLVALCSSTFAAEYGQNFDVRYALLFAIALLALTFHFVKFLPRWLISVMRGVTVVGLILFTIFVGCAAWLNKGTEQADPQIAAVIEKIEMLESRLTVKDMSVAALFAQKQYGNARQVSSNTKSLENKLLEAREELIALKSKEGTYESGAMAIFGHISKVTGLEQEAVNLLVMGSLLIVLVCMEITLGFAVVQDYSPAKTVPNDVNRTVSDEIGTKHETVLRKSKGKHVKNRTKVRTYIVGYLNKEGKYPTYSEVQEKCGVGRSLVSEIMNEIKGDDDNARNINSG